MITKYDSNSTHYLSVAWDMPVYACTAENVRNLLAAAHGIGKEQA